MLRMAMMLVSLMLLLSGALNVSSANAGCFTVKEERGKYFLINNCRDGRSYIYLDNESCINLMDANIQSRLQNSDRFGAAQEHPS